MNEIWIVLFCYKTTSPYGVIRCWVVVIMKCESGRGQRLEGFTTIIEYALKGALYMPKVSISEVAILNGQFLLLIRVIISPLSLGD